MDIQSGNRFSLKAPSSSDSSSTRTIGCNEHATPSTAADAEERLLAVLGRARRARLQVDGVQRLLMSRSRPIGGRGQSEVCRVVEANRNIPDRPPTAA